MPLLGIRGNVLTVKGLDMLDGTPVLDIKPYLAHGDRIAGTRAPRWIRRLWREQPGWRVGAADTGSGGKGSADWLDGHAVDVDRDAQAWDAGGRGRRPPAADLGLGRAEGGLRLVGPAAAPTAAA